MKPYISTCAAILVLACLGLGCSSLPAGSKDQDGFVSLFDGKTFRGWKAPDMSYWTVEDGAITATISEQHPLKDNQYLVWQGGELGDFELKLMYRLTGSEGVNGGFQYRSKLLPNYDIAGYQVDNNLTTDWVVRLYDEHGRETLAWRGESAYFDASGNRTVKPIEGVHGKPATFKLEEWHEYHLIAKGAHVELFVNGLKVAEFTDDDPKQQDFKGILGLQLHSGKPQKAQFKAIRLKKLD
ncbi:MAG: DUF1080 domain-containing protein [Candidatus Hydrogenedentes bacterium]|nr:DUF1080 domain-containing protein [Candidatus Hydrogenedentota bacterium]